MGIPSQPSQEPSGVQQKPERRLAAYLEEVNDLVFTLDVQGRLTYVNKATCKLLGYTEAELLGKSPLEFVHPGQRAEAAEVLAKVLRGESVESFRVRALTREGREVVLEFRGKIFRNKEGRVVETFHIARDVTTQIQAEEKLAREGRFRWQLLQLAQRLAPLVEEDQIFQILCHEVQELFQTSFVHFWLVDERRKTLVLRFGEEVQPSSLPIGYQVPLDDPEAAIARVARQGRGEVFRHIPKLPACKVSQKLAQTSRLQSAVVVPLPGEEGALVGVMVLGDQEDPERFGEGDLEKAQVLAQQAAGALRRAHLFADAQRRLHRLRALFEIDVSSVPPTLP